MKKRRRSGVDGSKGSRSHLEGVEGCCCKRRAPVCGMGPTLSFAHFSPPLQATTCRSSCSLTTHPRNPTSPTLVSSTHLSKSCSTGYTPPTSVCLTLLPRNFTSPTPVSLTLVFLRPISAVHTLLSFLRVHHSRRHPHHRNPRAVSLLPSNLPSHLPRASLHVHWMRASGRIRYTTFASNPQVGQSYNLLELRKYFLLTEAFVNWGGFSSSPSRATTGPSTTPFFESEPAVLPPPLPLPRKTKRLPLPPKNLMPTYGTQDDSRRDISMCEGFIATPGVIVVSTPPLPDEADVPNSLGYNHRSIQALYDKATQLALAGLLLLFNIFTFRCTYYS